VKKQEPKLFKALVGGLPFGLAALGILSFVFWASKRNVGEGGGGVSLHHRAVTEKALANYMRVLTEVIGPRSLSDTEKITQTANYIESTIGPRNMGYQVNRFPLFTGGVTSEVIAVVLEGDRRPDQMILVSAPYDAPAEPGALALRSAAVTALLSAANALVTNPQGKTVGFLLYVGAPSVREKAGNRMASLVKQRVVGEIDLAKDLVATDPGALKDTVDKLLVDIATQAQ